ncbi:hypothetical protein G6F63_015112 [Rhizopus arrhizus]|nr:hypothetical protein G6F63_015112 [Rhizopus arrhizus]
MKAIQKELGDLDAAPGELEELARKIAEAGMPKAVEAKARNELNKLKQMSPMSAEAAVVRNYLEWLLGVPRPSTPITTAWRRSRNASLNTWRCSRA